MTPEDIDRLEDNSRLDWRIGGYVREQYLDRLFPLARLALEAGEIVRSLRRARPSGYDCANFHHPKKSQHHPDEECLPFEQWVEALGKSSAFLARLEGTSDE